MRLPVRALVRQFLLLWFPGLAVFGFGLNACLQTGQADPWSWAMPVCVVLIIAAFLGGRHGVTRLVWAGVGWIGTLLLFCGMGAGRVPDHRAAAALVLLALLAGAGAVLLRNEGKARFFGAVMLVLAALLLWRPPPQPINSVPDRPELAVMTALPLFWTEDGSGQQADAPIISVLRTRFTIVPLDDPEALPYSSARLLLLAQPRALSPASLVAIDQWVRKGGRAVILADPQLRWPSTLPAGDRRRAPTTASSLSPLLARWRISPVNVIGRESRILLPDGSLLTLAGADAFRDGVVAVRRIGEGRVIWVGDADLLDDRLWLADPRRALDPRAWSADSPALLAQWLGHPLPGSRRWLATERHIASALRWGLLAGTVWAVMGAALFAAKFGINRSYRSLDKR